MKPWIAVLFLAAGCSSNAVDMDEPRRIVGTENAIRVDAQVIGDSARPGGLIPVTYEITNQRATSIAVADIIAETSWDAETNTITVNVGSEVPGNELLPRLIEIGPGEKKTFTASARLRNLVPMRAGDPVQPLPPAEFRLKVNFLGDTTPFRRLIGIQERAVADAKLADELFPLWLERHEVVYTNSIPMRWLPRQRAQTEGSGPRRR
jgi:hypothetical protein